MENTDRIWKEAADAARHRQEEPDQLELQINRPTPASLNEYGGVFDRPDTASLNVKKSVFDRMAVFHISKEE